jgi:hypothetical protein
MMAVGGLRRSSRPSELAEPPHESRFSSRTGTDVGAVGLIGGLIPGGGQWWGLAAFEGLVR